MLNGLPELTDLNMYGNKVAEIIIPHDTIVLSKLETLDLGDNNLTDLPDELDQLKALKTLKLMRNFLERIPMRVCDMDITNIDVSSNPSLRQPPMEACELGMSSMKEYYHDIRNEELRRHKALEEEQKNTTRQKKREEKNQFQKLMAIPWSDLVFHGAEHSVRSDAI